MALSGIALVMSESFSVLILAAFLGNLSGFVGGGGMGPLEQAVLAGSATPQRRTDLFALFSLIGTIAGSLGALASGLPTLLQRALGLEELASFHPVFVAYTALALLTALLYSRLSSRVELPSGEARWANPFTLPSRSRIFTLAGLFTVDSFGTGLIVQSLASYWFFTRFGLQPGQLGALFFASHVLTAVSLWAAARLARRIGLLNTMVFTHIPSSLSLIAVPFVPEAWMAIALWLLRAFCRADGRANEPVVHHGGCRPCRANCYGECRDREPKRWHGCRPVCWDSTVDRHWSQRTLHGWWCGQNRL